MIAHKRIRVRNGKLEEGPLQYPTKGAYSKAEGWTDFRVADIPLPAVIRSELVIATGQTISGILRQQTADYGGDWIVFNGTFFSGTTGALLGRAFNKGSTIAPDVPGKTEHRPHLYASLAGTFGIGRQEGPACVNWAITGVPTLTAGGSLVHPPRPAENMPADVAAANPRTIVGIKPDGTLGILLVDGRGPYDKGLTAQEAAVLAHHYGYSDAMNLDGGSSSTLATNNRQLLQALDIDAKQKQRNYHVADMSQDHRERVVHHAIAIQFDSARLFPQYAYRIDHISHSTPNNRRPGHKLEAATITIHNTANPSSTADNERKWLTNPQNTNTASYHIVIDDREAVECIPLNESAWHAGDGSGLASGNRTSMAIEICESGDYSRTLENAAHLIARMLKERGWGTERLRRHYDWSGKICPRKMYDGGWSIWEAFKKAIGEKLRQM